MAFYKSKFTGEEIDQRLTQGTYDDAVKAGFKGTKEEFDQLTWAFGKEQQELLKTAQQQRADNLETESKNIVEAINEIKESVDSISDPYEINLTNLLSAEDSESISTAIGGIDNLNATVRDNRIIVGTISNGSVSVSIRILGNVTTLYYLLDSVVGLTLNEVAITNTSGTLSKNITTHSVLTENMVINSLNSDETTLPLSAAQGKALDNKISSIDVSADITNAINALDSSGQTASTGEVISSVSQENGVISVSKKTLTSDDIPTLSIAKISNLQTSLDAKQDSLTAGTGLEITEDDVINVTLDTTVFKVVSALPDSPAQGDENKIHLVSAESSGANNTYTEYVWVNSAWEILGEYTSEVDLTDYLKTVDAESTYQKITDTTLTTNSKSVVGGINEVNGKAADAPTLALRKLYIEAGAVYNEDTGYYELNGLTDITEEQMLTIYAVFSDYKIEDINWKYAYTEARTNICPKSDTYASKAYPNFNGQRAFYFSKMEVIKISDYARSADLGFPLSQGDNMFDSCSNLKRIIGRLWVDKSSSLYSIFNNCKKLEDVQIYGLSLSISFSDSPLLNYASLDCLITNAANTAAITVTVHPTTYSYLSGTAQPTEEVGGTTEEWQALMTTAASKQISFATEE